MPVAIYMHNCLYIHNVLCVIAHNKIFEQEL